MQRVVRQGLGIFILAILFSCNSEEEMPKEYNDTHFDQWKEQFVLDLWAVYPDWASAVGYHQYDSIIPIPDDAYRMKQIVFAQKNLDTLNSFNLDSLGSHNKTDFFLIKNQLESIIWYINKFRQYQWDPSMYNVGGSIAEIINGLYAPADERMAALAHKLQYIPGYYAAAKASLKKPTLEHTELAIIQNQGTLGILEGNEIADSVNMASLSQNLKDEFPKRREAAISAVKNYVLWLQDTLKPKLQEEAKSFRIGKDHYEEKFKYDLQARFSAEEIYEKALSEKEKVQEEMLNLTEKLWPKYFQGKKDSIALADVKMMINKLSERHVAQKDFVSTIEKHLPELANFVKEKDLLYLDPEKPLQVRRTPEYMIGPAIASVSSPGPYDKYEPTYYNVNPIDEMEKERAESWLREYNYWMLQILNIHEAIPGHYAQLVYANESPSVIKSILGNTTMIEGWACYAERMMLESGYGNNEDELWLMYYKWYLRIITNTILDYSVHTLEMSKEDAMDLLVNQAFQEQTEAEGKWRRVTLTQVQLDSYFTGLTEILELRKELQEKLGDRYDLKAFNEKFLSYGSAPVKYIRQLMIAEYGLGE